MHRVRYIHNYRDNTINIKGPDGKLRWLTCIPTNPGKSSIKAIQWGNKEYYTSSTNKEESEDTEAEEEDDNDDDNDSKTSVEDEESRTNNAYRSLINALDKLGLIENYPK